MLNINNILKTVAVEMSKEILDLFSEAFLGKRLDYKKKSSRNKLELIFEGCGLRRGELSPTIAPEADGVFLVTMPLGMCLQDFQHKADAIAQALGDNIEVIFSHVGQSKLKMELLRGKLELFYEFKPVTLKNPAEFLIGPSKRGMVSVDFTKHPNLLVAGGTGSGKSTFIIQLILNTILTNPEVTLHLIDLKSGIEFINFKQVNSVESYADDIGPAADVIYKLETVMEKRQQELAGSGVVKLSDFNERYPYKKMKYHLVIVDEFANLREEKQVKQRFDKVLRMGRNVGIFFILSTQRPTVDTIPGNFSANIHCRLAFKTTNERESEIILGYGKQDAARIAVPGRGIFQATEQIEVQPMFIKNDDRVMLPILKPKFKPYTLKDTIIDTSGVIEC